MAIIASALVRIKSDPLGCLGGRQQVNEFFRRAGYAWRQRLLDPATTLRLFILQVLHGNTAITHLRHLAGFDVCPSSYCEARNRLPVQAVAGLVDAVSGEASRTSESSRSWRGHKVYVADATSVTAPDRPALQELWPQPAAQKLGLGFPVMKLLGMLDLVSGMIVGLSLMCLNVQETSELPHLAGMLSAGDLLLIDRGFCSFWNVASLVKSSILSVFRVHQRQIVDFTPHRPHQVRGKRAKRGRPTSRYVRRLGHEDQLVQWVKPARPRWLSVAEYALIPQTLQVRELRYHIVVPGRRTRVVTIATTLLDPVRYPKHEIARLYGLRWEIETNFRHLKTTMKMDQLKCRTVDGALKELLIFVLVYNLIRAAMTLAAARQGADPNRISFIDATRWLCACCRQLPTTPDIDLIVNPPRPGRYHPRALKRRMKPYDLMTRPRSDYPKPMPTEEVVT